MLKQPFLLKNFFSFLLQFVTIYYDIRVMGFKKKITKSDRGVSVIFSRDGLFESFFFN